MPSPYKTNCFDYTKYEIIPLINAQFNWHWKVGNLCQIKQKLTDTIIRTNLQNLIVFITELLIKSFVNRNTNNLIALFNTYTIKQNDQLKHRNNQTLHYFSNYIGKTEFNLSKDLHLVNYIQFVQSNEPYTIYRHSPQQHTVIHHNNIPSFTTTTYHHSPQHPAEFICFIGGIISLRLDFLSNQFMFMENGFHLSYKYKNNRKDLFIYWLII